MTAASSTAALILPVCVLNITLTFKGSPDGMLIHLVGYFHQTLVFLRCDKIGDLDFIC